MVADWTNKFGPLGGTLGTLIRTAKIQVDELRGAAVREAGSSRQKFDSALLKRRRKTIAADLGQRVYDLSATDLALVATDGEVAHLLHSIEELDREISIATLAQDEHDEYEPAEEPMRVWRPNLDDIE